MAKVTEVFGVSKDMIRSYIEREQVDGGFKRALDSDKHIVIYGSSKQGKSALRRKHLREDKQVIVQCGPTQTTLNIYSSILRQVGVQLVSETVDHTSTTADIHGKFSFKALLPWIGGGEGEFGSTLEGTKEHETSYTTIPINLSLAQDVGEILKMRKFDKFIVLENFHYLDEEVQKQLAFDLRSFQELGIRFIILGIWREKNRLTQFNGDLVDRVTEIPVEPWENRDFDRVIEKGCSELNIRFSTDLIKKIKDNAFGNIGIVQELCKNLCLKAGIEEPQRELTEINDDLYLEEAIKVKVEEYGSRHLRALESIAEGNRKYEEGLFLPYYIVRVIVESPVVELVNGIVRQELHTKIKEIHHRPDNVRGSDMTNLLHGLARLQMNKGVVPPLFDYDRTNRRLRIIDSTLFFFLQFANKDEIMAEIPDPTD